MLSRHGESASAEPAVAAGFDGLWRRNSDVPVGLELALEATQRSKTVRNRRTQSALLVVGAAAGAAAATWLHRRRLSVVNTAADELIEPESAELPLGKSADPEVDGGLSRTKLPQDDTSGAALFSERELAADLGDVAEDESLNEIWDASSAEGSDRGEGYDAVSPESLGQVWLERATGTTPEGRADASDPSDLPEIGGYLVSEATLASSHLGDHEDDELDYDQEEDDEEDSDEADEAVPTERDEERPADSVSSTR